MKTLYLTLLALFTTSISSFAEKNIYIPREWQNRTDTLIYKENDTKMIKKF